MKIPWDSYSLVLFDFDDTLVDFGHSERHAIAVVCKSFNHNATEESHLTFKKINHALWSLHDKGELPRDQVFRERFQQFFTEIGVDGDANLANDIFLEALSAEVLLIPNALNLLTLLKEKMSVGIVTNGHGPTQRVRARKAGVAELAHIYVISDEVGVSKPDKRIFEIAYRMSNLPAGKPVLMVGDNIHADVEGAQKAGFDTCWVSNGKQPHPSIVPTFTVSSIQDLVIF